MEVIKVADNTKLHNHEFGEVNISDDVIGIITNIAAMEIEGVNGLYGSFGQDIAEMFGKKNLSKGVKVVIEENEVKVDLNIVVDFGIVIPDIAWKVQEKVKNSIENMTGLQVLEVNINVQGVNIEKDKKIADDE